MTGCLLPAAPGTLHDPLEAQYHGRPQGRLQSQHQVSLALILTALFILGLGVLLWCRRRRSPQVQLVPQVGAPGPVWEWGLGASWVRLGHRMDTRPRELAPMWLRGVGCRGPRAEALHQTTLAGPGPQALAASPGHPGGQLGGWVGAGLPGDPGCVAGAVCAGVCECVCYTGMSERFLAHPHPAPDSPPPRRVGSELRKEWTLARSVKKHTWRPGRPLRPRPDGATSTGWSRAQQGALLAHSTRLADMSPRW